MANSFALTIALLCFVATNLYIFGGPKLDKIANSHEVSNQVVSSRRLNQDTVEDRVAVNVNETEVVKRTAILWTTFGVTTLCEMERLRHLVETSGGMDVWVLHAHHLLHRPQAEARSLRKIERIPGLHLWNQTTLKYPMFDNLAGTSKNSILRFLEAHPEYDYAWAIENDMFFTGAWQDVLKSESLRDTKTDFLTMLQIKHNTTSDWVWTHHRECHLWGKQCRHIKDEQVGWMTSRISSRLARSLLKDLDAGYIVGFHEAVIAPYCAIKRFSVDRIHPSKVGVWQFGHMSRYDKKEYFHMDYMSPSRGTLIHPVKCNAYNHLYPNRSITEDIQKWL